MDRKDKQEKEIKGRKEELKEENSKKERANFNPRVRVAVPPSSKAIAKLKQINVSQTKGNNVLTLDPNSFLIGVLTGVGIFTVMGILFRGKKV